MKPLNFQQNTPEWLAMRRNCIGASDAPIIMGLSPYKKRDQLLEEKVYGKNTAMSASMQYGKDMEPTLLDVAPAFQVACQYFQVGCMPIVLGLG